jgi:hypothetical protein
LHPPREEIGMERIQQFGYDVWALVKGYWGSEER